MIRLTAVIEIEGQAPRALAHESVGRSIILGRDASADFQIPLSTISRQHAKIFEHDQVYVIEDLGSTHGTLVNGKSIGTGTKKVLRDGDIIELAKARITCAFENLDALAAEPGEGTQAVAMRAVEGILGRLGEGHARGPYFRVLNGEGEGRRISLDGSISEWSVGRSKDCEIVLNDSNISRRHAVVRKDWQGFTIEDLGSKNGVSVNEQTISKPRRLRDRDEITVGPVKLVYVDPDADLLSALKDVPGFRLDNPDELEEDVAPAPLGAPPDPEDPSEDVDRSDEDPFLFGDEPDGSVHSEDEGVDDIDPELLEPLATGRGIFEWVMIAIVMALLAGAGYLLFVLSS